VPRANTPVPLSLNPLWIASIVATELIAPAGFVPQFVVVD